jgi:predicted nucleic acid-binding protein
VLIEIGNALSKVRWRALGFATIQDLRTDPDITVVSVDTSLLDRAVTLYGARLDKEWSLTDCISFVVIQERGLIQALTTDHHFGQVGIENLLPEPD